MKDKNRIILVGTVTEDIQIDLVYNGVVYYKTYMKVVQPSGYVDQIMVIAKKKKFKKNGAKPGRRLYIEGTVETRNEYDMDNNMHVVLYVRAETMKGINKGKDRNEVTLKGRISKSPHYYKSETSRSRIQLILEAEDSDEGIVSYVPCVAWKRLADILSKMSSHEELEIEGLFHSRNYTQKSDQSKERTAYEIVICNLI